MKSYVHFDHSFYTGNFKKILFYTINITYNINFLNYNCGSSQKYPFSLNISNTATSNALF